MVIKVKVNGVTSPFNRGTSYVTKRYGKNKRRCENETFADLSLFLSVSVFRLLSSMKTAAFALFLCGLIVTGAAAGQRAEVSLLPQLVTKLTSTKIFLVDKIDTRK